MEYAIVHNDLKEKEIKPKALLKSYNELVARDVSVFFSTSTLERASCPCCRGSQVAEGFSKLGMSYSSCAECRTLYVNPRPSPTQIESFFRNSEARRFWLEKIWPQTGETRRKKILEPLLDWILTFLKPDFSKANPTVAEVFPSNWGAFETWRRMKPAMQWVLVEPLFPADLCPIIDWKSQVRRSSTSEAFDAVCLLDTIGRAVNPLDLLEWSANHLKTDGLCFLTTLFSTGFDLLTLGANSEALIPPDRLNVPSYEGLKKAVERLPFEVLEWSTPGVLDLHNVAEAIRDYGFTAPSFLRYILETRKDPEVIESFQDFLQQHQLSSQGRIVLKKCG
jgi:methyltransferase family protein